MVICTMKLLLPILLLLTGCVAQKTPATSNPAPPTPPGMTMAAPVAKAALPQIVPPPPVQIPYTLTWNGSNPPTTNYQYRLIASTNLLTWTILTNVTASAWVSSNGVEYSYRASFTTSDLDKFFNAGTFFYP